MALPTEIFVHIEGREEPIKLTGVTDWRYCKWRTPAGTYRNGENIALGTATIEGEGASTLGEAVGVPVYSTQDVGATFRNAATLMKVAVADEVLGIAPRQKWEIISGLVVALGTASIPVASSVSQSAVTLGRKIITGVGATVDNTTNLWTTATQHGLATGDTVYALSLAGLPPAPVDPTKVYKVIRQSLTGFFLQDPVTGTILDLTGTYTLPFVQVITQAPRIVPSSKTVRPNLAAETATDVDFLDFAEDALDNFISGDIVTVQGSLPTGLVANTFYKLSALGPVYQFHNISTGAIIALSVSAADFTIVMQTPLLGEEEISSFDTLQLDGISGLVRFPDSLSPKISNVE